MFYHYQTKQISTCLLIVFRKTAIALYVPFARKSVIIPLMPPILPFVTKHQILAIASIAAIAATLVNFLYN